VPGYVMHLGDGYVTRGTVFAGRREPGAALEWYAKAVAKLESLAAAEAPPGAARLGLRNVHGRRAEALAKLGRHAEAARDGDGVLERDAGSTRTGLRWIRADGLARAGEVVRAAAEAEDLAAAAGATAATLYDCACVVAVAAARGTPDSDRYAARAVG